MGLFVKKIMVFCIPVGLFFIGLGVYNYVHDPYGVVRGDMENQWIEPNQRYLKTKFIINHPNQYNAFFFGSSRVGKIDTRKIGDGNSWYNMSYSQGLPAEFLYDIKRLLRKKVEIQKLVIGLDDISYLVSPELHKDNLLRQAYKNRLFPLFDYLMLKPIPELLAQREELSRRPFYTVYDIYDSGIPIVYNRDEWINANAEEHINDPKFEDRSTATYYADYVTQSIEALAEIVELCETHEIELTLFINPMHIRAYANQDAELFSRFLKELALLHSFYDFSGINETTTNHFNYYETSHFRPFIGDQIIERLFDETNTDFGKLVTPKNIEEVILVKNKELE